MDQNIFNDINQRVRDVFANSPAADVEKNVRALLASFFARLDLVTREEFDIQRQVLLKTREKLSQLETQLADIERRMASPHEQSQSTSSGTPGPGLSASSP